MDEKLTSVEDDIARRLGNWRVSDKVDVTEPDVLNNRKKRSLMKRKKVRPQKAQDQGSKDISEVLDRAKAEAASRSRMAIAKFIIRPETKTDWLNPNRTEICARLGSVSAPSTVKDREKRASWRRERRHSTATGSFVRKGDQQESRVDPMRYVERHRSEVGDLGCSALGKKEKKKYELARLAKLGCKPPKNQRKPIGILVGIRKKEKERAKKQKERMLETGMLVRARRNSKR